MAQILLSNGTAAATPSAGKVSVYTKTSDKKLYFKDDAGLESQATNATHTGDATGSGALTVVAINGTNMAALATGLLKNTTTTGVPSVASAGTDYVAPGGALGTPSSGTLTSCTGLPVAGIAGSTTTALGVGSVELGHATDTTITRTGAGAIAVEGVAVLLSGGALGTPASGTLTNCTKDGTNGVGYLNIPQNSQSAAYTTVLADSGKHILHPSADTTARTFTIDSNANVAYPVGTAITFVNQNAGGVITIAITTDTMRLAGAGTTGSRTLAANGVATALKVTSTEWIISGTGLT